MSSSKHNQQCNQDIGVLVRYSISGRGFLYLALVEQSKLHLLDCSLLVSYRNKALWLSKRNRTSPIALGDPTPWRVFMTFHVNISAVLMAQRVEAFLSS